MSVNHTALLSRSNVPPLTDLQGAIDSLKFKMTVDDGYRPFETNGYLPCTINGEDGGFDIRFEPAQAIYEKLPDAKALAGERDVAVQLRSGGDPREDVCALMVAAALADKFQAVVIHAKKGTAIPLEKLITEARSKFAELD